VTSGWRWSRVSGDQTPRKARRANGEWQMALDFACSHTDRTEFRLSGNFGVNKSIKEEFGE